MDDFFNNNLGMHALIIYFCFVPIDLINDYKNHKIVYSRNNNVCLGVWFFMCIVTFKVVFSMKSDIRDFWGMG